MIDESESDPSQTESTPDSPPTSVEPPPLPQAIRPEQQDDNSWSLTDESSSGSAEPPPLPPAKLTTQDSLKGLLSKSKGLAGKLGAAAKSAGVFAANQAERTKLVNVTIPGQYTKLGKLVYESNLLREDSEFAELLAAIDQLHERTKDLESQSESSQAGN